MNAVTIHDIRAFCANATAAMLQLEDGLNSVDRILGDGDTGTMLSRLAGAVAQTGDAATTIPQLFSSYAVAASESTGSSLGTLTSAALLSMSKMAEHWQTELPASKLGELVETARDAVLRLGKSRLGDKTIADSLDAVSRALSAARPTDDLRKLAVTAADMAVSAFRGHPCRVGRARLWPERSRGEDDPGMLALALILQAALASTPEPSQLPQQLAWDEG